MKSRMSDKGRFKRKRGKGEFEYYVPWIWVTDFSSIGLRTRVFGVKSNRLHHLLSLLELRVFYILESMEVVDIKEQFPLFPASETVMIAEANNIKHPKWGGLPLVRTTDFLVITKERVIAICVKYKSELEKPRVRELIEIERQYWLRRSVEFVIITEEDISWNGFRNAERIRAFAKRPVTSISDQSFLERLMIYKSSPSIETKHALERIADDVSESFATLHHLFLHLIFHKKIRFDYSVAPALNTRLNDLWF